MSKKIYGLIANIPALKLLQDEADLFGLTAVGVANNGALFIYDNIAHKHTAINEVRAAEILDLTVEQVQEIIETKSEVIFNDKFGDDFELEDVEDDITEDLPFAGDFVEDDLLLDSDNFETKEDADEDNNLFQSENVEVQTEDIPTEVINLETRQDIIIELEKLQSVKNEISDVILNISKLL